jgi:zinc protease
LIRHNDRQAPARAARLFIFALGLPLLALAHDAHAADAPAPAVDAAGVLRTTLPNGLRVVIVENKLAPVVTTLVNYVVGADETPPGFPGMAHAQEHMMFRGSPGLTVEQLAEISAIMGGNSDADTRQTVTQYEYTVPAEDLEVVLHIEATRMAAVDDDAEAWAKERKAIEQEVAQDLSSPTYVLSTKVREALFAGTTYDHDALGTRPSFDATTADMLKDFHAKWYAPNNAVLVIAGDVNTQATLAEVRRLFGGLTSKALPARPGFDLQPMKSQQIVLDSDLPYGLAVIAFRMPGSDDPDWAAAEILSDVLSNQRGDLYGMVPEGKLLDAAFSYDPLAKAGIGEAIIAYATDAKSPPLLDEVKTILTRTVKDGVSADLVAAAKRQERRTAEFQKNSISELAVAWSEAVAVDGRPSPQTELDELQKVTVEDVNRVARKYLDLDHDVIATLTPRHSGQPVSASGFGGRESIPLGEAKSVMLPDWAQSRLTRIEVPEATVHPIESWLPNGLHLIVQPETINDTVSVIGRVRNRPELQVPPGKEGLSQVVDQMLGYGTETLERVAFQKAQDDIGADVEPGTDFSLQVLADQFDRGVELLADNELHPALPDKAFAVVRKQVGDRVAGRLKSPNYLAEHALREALYPKGDPTLREALPTTVGAVTLEALRGYYKSAFRPDLTTIVVIGNVTPEAARAEIEKYFGAWRAEGPKPETLLPHVPANHPQSTVVPDASRVQDKVMLAETLPILRSDPAYYALQLGNHVLGGAFYSTRLYRDLRKENGLVYYVGSYLDVGLSRGIYLLEYACDPPNVFKARDIIARELGDMRAKPVPVEELRAAKAQMMREITLAEADVNGIARGFLDRVQRELPLDEPFRAAKRYLDLDSAAVQKAFVENIRPQDLVQVTQGPEPH